MRQIFFDIRINMNICLAAYWVYALCDVLCENNQHFYPKGTLMLLQ